MTTESDGLEPVSTHVGAGELPRLSSPHPDPGETDPKLGSVQPSSSRPILNEVKQPGSGRVKEKSYSPAPNLLIDFYTYISYLPRYLTAIIMVDI